MDIQKIPSNLQINVDDFIPGQTWNEAGILDFFQRQMPALVEHWNTETPKIAQAAVDTQTIKNETQSIKDQIQTIKNEAEQIKADTETIRSNAETIKNEAEQIKGDIETIKTEVISNKEAMDNIASGIAGNTELSGLQFVTNLKKIGTWDKYLHKYQNFAIKFKGDNIMSSFDVGANYFSINASEVYSFDGVLTNARGFSVSFYGKKTELTVEGGETDKNIFKARNGLNLGTSTHRMTSLYLKSAPNVSSDERIKTNIRELTDKEVVAGLEIAQKIKIFQLKNKVEKEGKKARLHTGVIAQEVKAIMKRHGLDPFRYSFFCYDKWEAREAEYKQDENGNKTEISPAQEAGDLYSVRYEELSMFLLACQATQMQKISSALGI